MYGARGIQLKKLALRDVIVMLLAVAQWRYDEMLTRFRNVVHLSRGAHRILNCLIAADKRTDRGVDAFLGQVTVVFSRARFGDFIPLRYDSIDGRFEGVRGQ